MEERKTMGNGKKTGDRYKETDKERVSTGGERSIEGRAKVMICRSTDGGFSDPSSV